MECVEKMILIQRDGRDIRKSQMTGFCPQSVWQDFISAEQNIPQEAKLIQRENQYYGFTWGSHQNDIFSKAAEMLRSRNLRQQPVATQHASTQPRRAQNQAVPRRNQRSKPNPRRRR